MGCDITRRISDGNESKRHGDTRAGWRQPGACDGLCGRSILYCVIVPCSFSQGERPVWYGLFRTHLLRCSLVSNSPAMAATVLGGSDAGCSATLPVEYQAGMSRKGMGIHELAGVSPVHVMACAAVQFCIV